MTATDGSTARLARWLATPRDALGLAAFRIAFGAVALFGVVRFASRGWIQELYLAPDFHFTYLGFEWVRPWPAWGMALHFTVLAAAAFGLMIGAWTRLAALVYFLAFTYAELIDKALYLNHYYLVSLLALVLVFVPSNAALSIDAWRAGRSGATVGRWAYVLLRSQVAVVYLFAGGAKLSSDWLVHAEPLATWLAAGADWPWVGPLLVEPWTAHAMSWGGAAYDLLVVPFLLWKRTRRIAFVAVVLFHLAIWLLFPVGIFSWVMIASSTLFFDPAWPGRMLRRVGGQRSATQGAPVTPLTSLGLAAMGIYLAVQVLLPLRFLVYPGDVNWTEEAFRFSWRVMLVEKAGQVEYEVVTDAPSRRFVVYPRAELTPLQYRMMVTAPDMIHEYALALRDRFRRDGYRSVRVYAHAWAAMNGHPSQRLIDPTVDLAAQERSLASKGWIIPLGLNDGRVAGR